MCDTLPMKMGWRFEFSLWMFISDNQPWNEHAGRPYCSLLWRMWMLFNLQLQSVILFQYWTRTRWNTNEGLKRPPAHPTSIWKWTTLVLMKLGPFCCHFVTGWFVQSNSGVSRQTESQPGSGTMKTPSPIPGKATRAVLFKEFRLPTFPCAAGHYI